MMNLITHWDYWCIDVYGFNYTLGTIDRYMYEEFNYTLETIDA